MFSPVSEVLPMVQLIPWKLWSYLVKRFWKKLSVFALKPPNANVHACQPFTACCATPVTRVSNVYILLFHTVIKNDFLRIQVIQNYFIYCGKYYLNNDNSWHQKLRLKFKLWLPLGKAQQTKNNDVYKIIQCW